MLSKYTWRHDSVLQAITNFVIEHVGADVTVCADLGKYSHPNSYSVLPSQFAISSLRPDIVVYSESRKIVCLIELTVPAEELVQNAMERKHRRYLDLVQNINPRWKPDLFTVEIGSCGLDTQSVAMLAQSLVKAKLAKPIPAAHIRALRRQCSLIALYCSYHIWLTRLTEWFPEAQALMCIN